MIDMLNLQILHNTVLQPPCMNCVLIEMGEMVCYSERCPDCGRWEAGQGRPGVIVVLILQNSARKKEETPGEAEEIHGQKNISKEAASKGIN